MIDKGLIFVYALEALAIGLLVSSIGTMTSIASESFEDEKTKQKKIVRWFGTLIAAGSAHVLAESLRHDRILDVVKNVSSRFHFKKVNSVVPLSSSKPKFGFRKRSILQPIIVKPKF